MYIYMFYLSDHSLTHSLTYLLSYPNSRDAIASKNINCEINFSARIVLLPQSCKSVLFLKLNGQQLASATQGLANDFESCEIYWMH